MPTAGMATPIAPMRNTTRASPTQQPEAGSASVVLPILIAVLGIALTTMALPRFWAAGHRLPANSVLDSLSNDHSVDGPLLRRAEQALISSLGIRDQGSALDDLARINLHQALQENLDSPLGAAWLTAAGKHQRQALAKSPANAFGWLRLSHIALLQDGVSQARQSSAVAALMAARAQSPNYKALLWQQLDFAFLLWPSLTPEERKQMRHQVETAAEISNWSLVRLAIARHTAAGVRETLASRPKLLADFDKVYLRLIKPRS